jgi:DNA-directed RNA polymerase specialized sigma24 family protein
VVTEDESALEGLARAAANGDSAARQRLVEQLWPFWLNRVRTRKGMRLLSHSDDHVHNVVARLVQKLLATATLESFVEWRRGAPQASFMQWLSQVTDNEALDYVRSVAGRVPAAETEEGPSRKLLLNEFSTSPILEELGMRPPNTELQTAQQLLQFARSRLPDEQLRVVTLWLQGDTDEEIALALNIKTHASRSLRRAAIARLRREFGAESDPA